MKKLVFFLLLTGPVIVGESFSQSTEPAKKKSNSNPGISLSYYNSKFRIKENNWTQTTYVDSFNAVTAEGLGAFSLAFLLHVPLSKSFDFRPKFQLSFDQAGIDYNLKTGGMKRQKVERLFLDLPLHVIGKFGKGNAILYLLGGSTVRFGLSDEDPDDKLKSGKFDISADLGVGIQLKTKTVIICPEFIFSNGLIDQKGNPSNMYNNVLDSYKKQAIIFCLNFIFSKL